MFAKVFYKESPLLYMIMDMPTSKPDMVVTSLSDVLGRRYK